MTSDKTDGKVNDNDKKKRKYTKTGKYIKKIIMR